jgi:superfamily I DNA/RNA helicase
LRQKRWLTENFIADNSQNLPFIPGKTGKIRTLDFGDLIMQTVLKLQEHADILAKYRENLNNFG